MYHASIDLILVVEERQDAAAHLLGQTEEFALFEVFLLDCLAHYLVKFAEDLLAFYLELGRRGV